MIYWRRKPDCVSKCTSEFDWQSLKTIGLVP
jgi:hypothetical protein